MRPRQRMCKRGHDLEEYRMFRSNGHSHGCRLCARLTSSASRRRRRELAKNPEPLPRGANYGPLLDFAPIEERLVKMGIVLSTVFNGHSLRRWRTQGISISSADAVCVRFGWHPVQVYGLDFYKDTDEQETA